MVINEICEHGKTTISGGNITKNCRPCANHYSNESFSSPNIDGKFNHGLGMMTYGTMDAEKKAESLGLTPIGNEKIRQPEKKDTITPILQEGIKKLKNLGSY